MAGPICALASALATPAAVIGSSEETAPLVFIAACEADTDDQIAGGADPEAECGGCP